MKKDLPDGIEFDGEVYWSICPECGYQQGDMGNGIGCEECGFLMPTMDTGEDEETKKEN